ncbi:MAG TPA: autotransporter outer membrane beta-barrel domain-containing protein [Lysobacter sp.]
MARIAFGRLQAALTVGLGLQGMGIGQALAQDSGETSSSGTLYIQSYFYDGRRNDAYQTRITSTIDGIELLFDQRYDAAPENPLTQAGLVEAGRIREVAHGGAPGVLVWDAPVLVDSWEELLDAFTEVSTVTNPAVTVTTVQTTSGDADNNIVYVGERGTCYDSGASGSTNTAPFDGAFASCDYGDEYYVPAGTVNTNTHTSRIIETVEVSFTNYDYLNYAHYQLSGHVELVGTVHPATLTATYEGGRGFLSRMANHGRGRPAMRGEDSGDDAMRFWFEGHRSRAESDADAHAVGNEREHSGASAGLLFAPSSRWRVGFALDRTDIDVAVRGAPESARIDLTQFGLQADFDAGDWFASAAVVHSRADADTRHGNARLGGVSSGQTDLSMWGAGVRAGYRVGFGGIEVTPMAGLDWARVRSDGFEENGGIALRSDGDSARRSAAWGGLEVSHRWEWPEGRALTLAASGKRWNVLSGRERKTPVSLVAQPGAELFVTGVPEAGHGSELQLALSGQLNASVSIHLAAQSRRGEGDRDTRFVAGLVIDW